MRSFLNQIEQRNLISTSLRENVIIIRKSNRNPRPAASHTAGREVERNEPALDRKRTQTQPLGFSRPLCFCTRTHSTYTIYKLKKRENAIQRPRRGVVESSSPSDATTDFEWRRNMPRLFKGLHIMLHGMPQHLTILTTGSVFQRKLQVFSRARGRFMRAVAAGETSFLLTQIRL